MKAGQLCVARLNPNAWGRTSPCDRPAKVECGGECYCTIHDPKRIAAKNAANMARWKAEKEVAARNRLLHDAAPELLAALRLFVGENTSHTERGRLDAARAAIAKATGGAA